MSINTYLNQNLEKKIRSGFTLEGKPSLGSAVSFKGRFQDKQTRLVDSNGVEFTTDGEVWMKPDESINLEDYIIYESVNYKVVRIDTKRKFDGEVNHKKALVVKTKE